MNEIKEMKGEKKVRWKSWRGECKGRRKSWVETGGKAGGKGHREMSEMLKQESE